MQTYEFFRRAVTPMLPDAEETARAILAGPAPKRRFAARYAAAAAAVAVILAAGAAALPHLMPSAPTAPPAAPALSAPPVTQPPSAPTPTPPPAPAPAEPEPEPEPETPPDEIHIHDLTDSLEVDFALSRELSNMLLENQEWWNLRRIRDYWGWDPLPSELPEGLKPTFDDDARWQYAAAPEKDFVWDQFSFTWREHPGSEEYDPLERQVHMTVSTREIFECGLLVDRADMEASTVGGVTMYLGYRAMGYGPYTVVEDGDNIPAGYSDVYVAEFQRGGLRIQVDTDNLTEAEFLAVLRSIAAQPAAA